MVRRPHDRWAARTSCYLSAMAPDHTRFERAGGKLLLCPKVDDFARLFLSRTWLNRLG